MNITFYNSTAEPNRLDKTGFLTVIKSITNAIPRGDIGVLNPVLTIEATELSIPGANYCYIEDWGRYYFVTDIHSPIKNVWIITCRCDTLMSFKNQIMQLSGIVDRQENVYNMYLPGEIPSETRPLVTTVKMTPSIVIPGNSSQPAFSNQGAEYVLLAVGGK